MNKKITEDKKSGTITLQVTLSKRQSADDAIVNFLTNDAKRLLSEEGFNVAGCRKKDSITNHREADSHIGEWVFDVSSPHNLIPPQKQKESLTKEASSDRILKTKKNVNNSQRKGK